MKLVCFPWAGGSSALYSSWLDHPGIASAFSSVICIDYPGRASRFDEEPIKHIGPLVDDILDHYTCFNDEDKEDIVLFGHSFGAIVAFEVALRFEKLDKHPKVKAVFVSASVPPSKSSLVQTPVSTLSVDGICDYFASKGNPVSKAVLNNEEFLEIFIKNVRADYSCLEAHPVTTASIKARLIVIGGELDKGVELGDLEGWKRHHAGGSNETEDVLIKVYAQQGHFYVSDHSVLMDLGDFVATTSCDIHEDKGEDSGLDAMVSTVKTIFSKVLRVDIALIGLSSDFFELGGSSLDTIALICRIERDVSIQVSQNEFFLNPTVKELALRMLEIKASSQEFPKLVALEDSNDNKWFPASHSQEQMIALWETNPCMYNMSTTIEFPREAIDVDILRRAFVFVVEQQPTLRTVVKIKDGTKFMQKVLPSHLAEECFELKVITSVEDEEQLQSVIKTENQYIFPLYDPPIVRGVIIKNVDGSDFLHLSQYHVGSDSWALVILRRQLLEAYMAIRSTGIVAGVRTTPAHPNFIDWTMWNRKCLLEYGEEERQLDYWKDKLKDLPLLKLPLDKQRPSSLGSKGLQIPINIDYDTINAFRSSISSHGANLYAGLLSVYMLLLHRMGGGDDFAIGVALANRNSEGLHDLIGYFANEVSVRATCQDDMKFGELLCQVRENLLGGMANADVPFHDVVKALRVPRDSSRTPIFQAFFALQERKWWTLEDISPPPEDELQFQLKTFSSSISKFEVHMFIRDTEEGGIEGDLTISTDLFNESTGQRLAEAFQLLVANIASSGHSNSLLSYDITPEKDKSIALMANDTTVEFESPVQSVLEWAYDSETQAALFCHGADDEYVSYGELRTMSSSVHSYLSSCVQYGEPVGVMIRSTAQGISAIFGAVSYGSPIVVVDPEKTTVERSKMILQDAGVCLVLIDNSVVEKFEILATDFKLTTLGEAHDCALSDCLEVAPKNRDGVFGYFYTSGTTGLPKGAIITHGNVLNLVNWWSGFFDLKQSDNVLLFSSLSFIMSLRQYLPTLCKGGTVVLPDSNVNFETAIIKGRVNKLVCTPSALSVLDIDKVAPNIQAVQVAGEAPRLAVMLAWKSRVPKLYIGLGPTELTAHALCGEFDGKNICIGFPASNVKAYIINPASGSETPVNVVGELWVSGENVCNGYLNRPELDERFTVDPMGSGLRCYKTGDLAKRRSDGRIEFLGRIDTQLKINGFRLEASEVINALPSELKNAHVMVGEGQLLLYKTNELSATQVRNILEAGLPPYMVPKKYFTIDSFPLNKNRKLDIQQLVSQAKHEPYHQLDVVDDVEEDRDALEMTKRVCLVWSNVLKVSIDDIKPTSNFFEIGGTSLSAVLVARGLGSHLGGREVPVQDIFAHQTLRSLSKHLLGTGDLLLAGDPRPLRFLPGGEKALHPIMRSIVQGIGLLFMSFVLFVPVIGTLLVSARSLAWFGKIGGALIPAILAGGCFVHLSIVLAVKWVIIGRYKEGKAVVFSWYFLKWWLLRRIISSTKLYTWAIDDTELAGYFLRALGATLGRNISFENAYLLEPDLVRIGDDTVVEFEVCFNTSEVVRGMLELRRIEVGENVRLGTRSVLLGGASVHDWSEVAPKSLVDYSSSTTEPMQILVGSPAKIESNRGLRLDRRPWRPKRSSLFKTAQILCCFIFPAIFSGCLYIGAIIAEILANKFGAAGVLLYMISLFSYTCGLIFLIVTALLKKMLIPKLEEGFVYTGEWFALRKWLLDRLFLSPAYSFSLQRSLETTSSYPFYLKLLGVQLDGSKVWLTYCSLRVGMELLIVKGNVHTGMQTYISTSVESWDGVSFHHVSIGNDTSCGQRSIILSGTKLGKNVTIGAETCTGHNTRVGDNGTAFGSPLVIFQSSRTNAESISESQHLARRMSLGLEIEPAQLDSEPEPEQLQELTSSEDKGTTLPFWLYALIMNIAQFILPVIVIGSYVAIYVGCLAVFGSFGPVGLALMIPTTFILGSISLMFIIKLLQLAFFGGSMITGTIHFYSVQFMGWYFLSDLVYLCTQTVFVPFSGTEIFCQWLRLMGSKIGNGVFISPENGGLRELDFLIVGDNCHILTPNINSHYADHGAMQFCPIIFSDGCVVNPGATVMPLTEYGEGSTLRPFAVTSKGQSCKAHTQYVGNTAKAVTAESIDTVAILFAGLGSAYVGMFKDIELYPNALAMLHEASGVLNLDITELCTSSTIEIDDVNVAQMVVTVMNIVSIEIMKQREALLMSQATIVAGFSVGEFAALYFAGAISFKDVLNLVRVQCEEFAKLQTRSALCNIRGLVRKDVELLCKRFRCSIANVISDHSHSPDERKRNVFVCGGTSHSIDLIVSYVNGLGKNDAEGLEEGRRSQISAKKLPVKTANHTMLMMPAVNEFRRALARTGIQMPRHHLVYSNVTGRPYQSVAEIRKLLPLQMTKPVQWQATIEHIHFKEGCNRFVECGAMRSQSAMVKLILADHQDLKFYSSDDPEK